MCTENEEISDPCQPNLQNMPIVAIKEVLKNLDCRSIFRLRKVNRVLRYSIVDIRPDLHLNSVRFQLLFTKISTESCIEPLSYAQISMEDAQNLLKNPKLILNTLILDLRFLVDISIEKKDIEKKREELKKFYESLKILLENRENLLKTRKISLNLHRFSEATDFLKFVDPKELKSISIKTRAGSVREPIEIDCSEIEALEQWNNAEEIEIDANYILTPVESFATFKAISIRCNKISIEKLNEVKELFVHSSKLQVFIIVSYKFKGLKDQILLNFGPFDSYNEEFKTDCDGEIYDVRRTWKWIQDVSDSTEKFQITLNIGSGGHHIKFSKV